MSQSKHSPTPWEASAHQDGYGDVVYITSPPGTHPMPIAVCRGPDCKGNALHIQQCVNGCGGIELPEALPDALKALRELAEADGPEAVTAAQESARQWLALLGGSDELPTDHPSGLGYIGDYDADDSTDHDADDDTRDHRIEHTRTPWAYITTGHPARLTFVLRGADDYAISLMARRTDVERIVACVNACEEIPDPHRLSRMLIEMRLRALDPKTSVANVFVAHQVLAMLGMGS